MSSAEADIRTFHVVSRQHSYRNSRCIRCDTVIFQASDMAVENAKRVEPAD